MEEFSDINFLVVIEGQEYERSLRKIVSTIIISFSQYWTHKISSFHAKLILSFFQGLHPISLYTPGSSGNLRGSAEEFTMYILS